MPGGFVVRFDLFSVPLCQIAIGIHDQNEDTDTNFKLNAIVS
jgi:hypothetical protein